MFGSHTALPSASSHLHPLFSSSCHPERSEGSAFASLFFPFNFKLPALFILSLEGSVVEGSTACPVYPEPRRERSRRVNLLSPNSFRISTYAKRARNPFTMNTSKTKHLKPFRMNTYEKTGEGATQDRPTLVHPLERRYTILLLSVSSQLSAVSSAINRLSLTPSLDALDATSSLTPLFATLTRNTGGGGRSAQTTSSGDPSAFNFQLSTFDSFHPLLTTHYPLLTSFLLKPQPQMAHLYLCTCKKGPAAREPRYSPCAAS
jgi:hypothetical protein